MCLEYDYHSLSSVNPKISIHLKTWILKTYYLSNSFLQSQARKCSCNHSLRLYMFRCLDTGLDNNHQCLKKKKVMVRIDDNKISISTRNTSLYKIHLFASIEGIQFYSTKALHTGNSLETNLAQIKNGHGISWINLLFSWYRGMFFLSFKKGKETWICILSKTTFSKGTSEVVRRCTCNTISIHCSVWIWKSQSF